jgi:hypothetical protein
VQTEVQSEHVCEIKRPDAKTPPNIKARIVVGIVTGIYKDSRDQKAGENKKQIDSDPAGTEYPSQEDV